MISYAAALNGSSQPVNRINGYGSHRTPTGATYTVRPSKPSRLQRAAVSLAEELSKQRAEFRGRHGIPTPDREAIFAAMRPSRLRRDRHELGGSADAHLSTSHNFWKLAESAWDMDRNDAVPGRYVDRALDNLLPLTVDPQTGFPELNAFLKNCWVSWGADKNACDVSRRRTWPQIERLALRTAWIAGDAPILPQYAGPFQGALLTVEPDRLTSPDRKDSDVVHGVEVDPLTGAVERYYFLKERPGRRRWNTRPAIPALTSEHYMYVDAQDEGGRDQVLLVHDPKRFSETRGVTIFHAAFDLLGMSEDTLFAELQKQQTDSCIPAAITTERDLSLGGRDTDTTWDDDSTTRTLEALVPGTLPRLRPGEKIEGVANGGAKASFEPFMRFMLRLICLQMGLPYSLLAIDTTGTTFHGYRGEFEQAKLTFKWIQTWFPQVFHQPVYRWKAEEFVAQLEAGIAPGIGDKNLLRKLQKQARDAAAMGTLFKARIQGAAWPYVQPETDAKADALRKDEGLASPRQLAGERGRDLDEIQDEFVEDQAAFIRRAHAAAEKLSAELKVEIPFQALLPQTMGEFVAGLMGKGAQVQQQQPEEAQQPPEGDEPDGDEPDQAHQDNEDDAEDGEEADDGSDRG